MELALKQFNHSFWVPDDTPYLFKVEDILESGVFLKMKQFIQHGHTTCLQHSLAVSYLSYKTCEKYGLNAVAAARAGLLHDLFLYDWHKGMREKAKGLHGFTHPQAALDNALQHFELTDLEQEIILRHMWPLTLVPPRHKESYVVLWHDKVCSLRETLGRPLIQG